MQKFKDSNGKTWNIKITLSKAKEIKEEKGIDILGMTGIQTLTSLSVDPVAMYDLLTKVIIDKDIQELEDGFNGDTVGNAFDALSKEITYFFPINMRLKIQELIEQIQNKVAERMGKVLTMSDEDLEKASQEK
jgi:hypothetical protein